MTNPLLTDWETPPFSQIQPSHWAPAFEAGFAQGRDEIAAIVDNPSPASFANTIEALEAAGALLNRVASVFYSLAGTDSDDALEQLQRDFAPKFSAYSSEIVMNAALFERIERVWSMRDTLALDDQEARLLMLTHRGFVRHGAALKGDARKRLVELQQRLAVLGTSFTQNLLADERDWSMDIDDEVLATLPDFVSATARAAGAERGAAGAVVTLSRSLIVPFLQFCPRRDLRELAFQAWAARGANGGATDNREIVAEILALRQERAALLGFENFAAWKLATEMAKTPAAVRALLMEIWVPAQAAAQKDQQILEAMMQSDGINGPLQPWDWRYYSEQRRNKEHDLDEAALKPYFQLDLMIEAAFDCAKRLFGLHFEPQEKALHHPDARVWRVTRDDKEIALFIGDYFARSGKRSGAWCSAWRAQKHFGGSTTPQVINVCNFAKAAPGEKTLLSFDDARTLFHEFGHALHQMLSDVRYERMSGTSVARDFVELPSQLFEHWLETPQVLEQFARHATTDAPIPSGLVEKLKAASTYDMGFQTVEYLASALVDLDFHTGPAPSDPMQAQAQTLARIGMPSAITMRHATPHFAHVFAGDGYSAGYYSYMWSEVMDADAFSAFEESGDVFDPDLAKKLHDTILSRGGSKEADVLYTAFRGRMPGVEALLRGRGFEPAAGSEGYFRQGPTRL